MNTTKILIAGIGGVGGFFGGLLAKAYQESEQVEIYYLSRGKNLEKIQSDGLKIIDNGSEFHVFPKMVSDKVEDFGMVDFILFCTKTYSLDQIAKQVKPCVSESTVLVPLQNGVNSRETLLNHFPNNLITNGCVYLIGRLESPGIIVKKGNVGALYFGLNGTEDSRLNHLADIIAKSEIKSELSEDIDKVTWEKYIFLSSTATATSYFDSNLREVLTNPEKLELLKSLVNEVSGLARKKNINIRENQVERVLDIMGSLPEDATTSMHSDYINKSAHTEVESLTGYIVREGQSTGTEVPTFEKMYKALKA